MSGHKRWLTVGFVLGGLFILVGISLLLVSDSQQTELVKVKISEESSILGGICTQDIPSSSCGSYTVKVTSDLYGNETYVVTGYSEDEDARKRYENISGKIYEAKESGNEIMLKINDSNEIISVEEE